MSEQEKCPKCGAGVRATWHSYNGTATEYLCGHTIYADGIKTQYGEDCLRRQLAQRDERIRELEAEVERLQARVEELERGILEYVREKLLLMAKD